MIIRYGRVIDPANNIDDTLDILVKGGKIVKIDKKIDAGSSRVINAAGKWVVPGMIDIHTHLREPGYEYKETIRSGSLAAAAGGFTSIACMANTSPINDCKSVTEYISKKNKTEAIVNIYVIGAITKGLEGKRLSEMGELKDAGIVAFSDDGRGVSSSEVMRRAFEYSSMLNIPIISHCEDDTLSANGVMHEGIVATELGLRGIPAEAEEIMAARDIALVKLTGCKLHIAHVSSSGTVQLIREAKKNNLPVTCETAPHYFSLTDEAVRGFNTNAKINPPLRTQKDIQAIKEGLKDGTIDVIATDHAPHDSSEKEVEFVDAPFGIVGLETALPLLLSLVSKKILSVSEAFQKMTVNAAKVINISKGRIGVGDDADITIIDPNFRWVVDTSKFMSKGRNTPFECREMVGAVFKTIVSGKVVFKRDSSLNLV